MGSFGKLTASLLPKNTSVYSYDPAHETKDSPIGSHTFELVATADIVILAIPLKAYKPTLQKLNGLLKPETLIVDVCSVKTVPEQLLAKYLPNHTNLLLAHPLFGAQTIKDAGKGHKLIVTKAHGETAKKVLDYCEKKLGLEIKHLTAKEHDMAMAEVHALTFFLGRALNNTSINSAPPDLPPSYKSLLELVRLDKAHSEDLFETIELGNPYAAATRKAFVRQMLDLEKDLEKRGTLSGKS